MDRADDAALHGTAVLSTLPSIQRLPVFMKTQDVSAENTGYRKLGEEGR